VLIFPLKFKLKNTISTKAIFINPDKMFFIKSNSSLKTPFRRKPFLSIQIKCFL